MRTGKRPTASSLMFALIALVASAGFVRLGLWQLSRHSEVSAASQARSQLLELEPVRLDASTLDSVPVEELVGRRVTVSGTWDFGGEVVVRSRVHSGSPGIHVVTPLSLDPSPTSIRPPTTVLVLRGWLPSSNAAISRSTTHGESVVGRDAPRLALVEPSRTGLGEPVIELGEGDEAVLSYAALDVELIGGPDADLPPFFLQLLPREDGSIQSGQPLAVPALEAGDGPHMGYAIQWFSFALITIVGTIAFLRKRA